jgi:hypothetical protein
VDLLVEEVKTTKRDEVKRKQSERNNEEEIVKISHFPQEGGVKELRITRAGDGSYFLRLGTYSKGESEKQIIKLDEKEMAYILIKLFKSMG